MIVTRFAPSPTGPLHIGGLRTAIYAYALAKHNLGKFILRIEDTDKKREVKGSKEEIEEILRLFGLYWDKEYIQSERVKTGVYKEAARRLLEDGHAYLDQGAVRIKLPKNEKIGYHDIVLNKDIFWDTNFLKELVLLKSDGFPTYHLAVVVDDHDMGITHVLRGHDWLPSTPIHLLIYKYLGYEPPLIGHLTDILDPEGGKLSKRKKSASVKELLKEGYLPEAILNFVILLGWAPKDNREFFTLEEFIKVFDFKGFQKSNPVFNKLKLDWFNGYYIRQKSDEQLADLFLSFLKVKVDKKLILKICPLIKQRIKRLSDFENIAGFFFEEPKVDRDFLNPYKSFFRVVVDELENLKKWDRDSIERALDSLVKEKKLDARDLFMGIRIAVTGNKVGPPLTESLVILGRQKTLERVKKVLL